MARLLRSGANAWQARPLCALRRLARTTLQFAANGLPGRRAFRHMADTHGATRYARVATPYHYKASGSTGALHESSQVRITILPEVAPTHPPASSAGRQHR